MAKAKSRRRTALVLHDVVWGALACYRDSVGRRDRPPRPGSGIHQLSVDQPAFGVGVRPSYGLRRPGDNPDLESFFDRLTVGEPVVDPHAESLEELKTTAGKRIRYYNWVRRDSSLGDRSATAIIQDFYYAG